MRLALAFGRPDVDAFLEEIDAEQFDEWSDFLQLEPTGWQAMQMAVARLCWAAIQPQTKRKVRESDFILKTKAAAVKSEKVEKLRWEAQAIRSRVRDRILKTGK